jgi:redox-sensitive bicupin YhaK (pirin superfamily)
VQSWLTLGKGTSVVMGVSFEPGDVDLVVQQLQGADRAFHNWALFSYAMLYDSTNTAIASQDADQKSQRQEKRKALLPRLRELVQGGSEPSGVPPIPGGDPMLTIRRANERGHADHGWLRTFHTFSFASYHDPDHMGFSSLRVINEDFVQPGEGFGTHPHRDMEILTWVLEGSLEHKDSMGNGSYPAGRAQCMSAGTGITHSEYNPSKGGRHLLQSGSRRTRRRAAALAQKSAGGLKPGGLASSVADGHDGRSPSARTRFPDREDEAPRELSVDLGANRTGWLQVARGSLRANGEALEQGDGAAIQKEKKLSLVTSKGTELLLFDLR